MVQGFSRFFSQRDAAPQLTHSASNNARGGGHLPSALLFAALLVAQAASACGDLANTYGPYDYLKDRSKLKIVEDNHFNRGVEFLQRGMTSSIGADLDYTLRAFPNHHRALRAMDMLGRKEKTERPRGTTYTVECYFERAMRMRQDDATVRMLYGIYLIARDRKKEGLTELEAAEALGAKSANFHYNMGLAYLDAGKHEQSLRHAKQAYDMGFPLPGLREKLKRAGKWK